MLTDYTIVIEDASTNFSAYVIGLDGVITTGSTVEEVIENMHEAIPFHLQGLRLHGDQLPQRLPIIKTIHVAS